MSFAALHSDQTINKPTVAGVLSRMAVAAEDDRLVLRLVQENSLDQAIAFINARRVGKAARAGYLDAFIALGRGDLSGAIGFVRAYQTHHEKDVVALYNFGWLAENLFYLNQAPSIVSTALTAYAIAAHINRDFAPALDGMSRLYRFFPSESRPSLWTGDVHLKLSREHIAAALARAGARPRYLAAFDRRGKGWDNVLPLTWMAQNLLPTRSVLSAGCGAGFDLVWLHENGFKNLHGFDENAAAITAAKDIAHAMNAPIDYWIDDILQSRPLPVFDCIFSLHRLASLGAGAYERFFDLYADKVRQGGYLIFDAFDAANDTPSSPGGRARISEKNLAAIATAEGFCIANLFRESRSVPKTVYVFRRMRALPPPS